MESGSWYSDIIFTTNCESYSSTRHSDDESIYSLRVNPKPLLWPVNVCHGDHDALLVVNVHWSPAEWQRHMKCIELLSDTGKQVLFRLSSGHRLIGISQLTSRPFPPHNSFFSSSSLNTLHTLLCVVRLISAHRISVLFIITDKASRSLHFTSPPHSPVTVRNSEEMKQIRLVDLILNSDADRI